MTSLPSCRLLRRALVALKAVGHLGATRAAVARRPARRIQGDGGHEVDDIALLRLGRPPDPILAVIVDLRPRRGVVLPKIPAEEEEGSLGEVVPVRGRENGSVTVHLVA